MTGTVVFEQYNDNVPYRTVFYTLDSVEINAGGVVDIAPSGDPSVNGVVFAPMTSTEEAPVIGDTKVRSYELYIDTHVDAPDELERLAAITHKADGIGDLFVPLEGVSDMGGPADQFKIQFTNNTGFANIKVRLVLVCDV